jgi:hypothetical protein
MSVSERIFVILRDCLVEVEVLLLSNFRLFTEPDGFDFIDGFPFPNLFSDSFSLRLSWGLLSWFSFTLILNLSIIFLRGFVSDNWLFFLFISRDCLADFL